MLRVAQASRLCARLMRDPKKLFEWLEHDYFRRARPLRRVKRKLLWSVLVVCLAGLAIAFLPGNRTVFQAGPVSIKHAMVNHDCKECHVETFQPVKRLWPGQEAVHSVMDEACRRCHDGPIHHERALRSPHCAECHREHRGQAFLAQVADGHCTACHADLQKNSKAEGQKPVPDVSAFATGRHPDWELPSRDPGTVRFNHRLHLQAEGVADASGKVEHLRCGACHHPDAERHYFTPIRYEQECSRCHPLTVQVAGRWNDKEIRAAADRFRRAPAPHKAPEVVRAALRERLLQFVERYPGAVAAAGDAESERPFPGVRPEAPPPENSADWVENQLRKSENLLFSGPVGCRFCHQGEPPGEDGLPKFALSNIPARWLAHSRFSHRAHGMRDCLHCHAAAPTSDKASDVLMPAIASCMDCHNPTVGARSDCIECHRYHDRSKERELGGLLSR